jgi:hypothetical protein
MTDMTDYDRYLAVSKKFSSNFVKVIYAIYHL